MLRSSCLRAAGIGADWIVCLIVLWRLCGMVADLSGQAVDLWPLTTPHLKQIVHSLVEAAGAGVNLGLLDEDVLAAASLERIVFAPAIKAESAMKPHGTSRLITM